VSLNSGPVNVPVPVPVHEGRNWSEEWADGGRVDLDHEKLDARMEHTSPTMEKLSGGKPGTGTGTFTGTWPEHEDTP
jgi:hypothetical protein